MLKFVQCPFNKVQEKVKILKLLSIDFLSHGLWKSTTHVIIRLQRLTISDQGRIAGVWSKQIKNHHFLICRELTNYESLKFITTNNHTEFAIITWYFWWRCSGRRDETAGVLVFRDAKLLRGVEWVHCLFLFPLVLGKMQNYVFFV